MKRTKRFRKDKFWWTLAIAVMFVTVHHFVLRPWFLNWGAPQRIQALTLPGDELISGKGHTRAVRIEATPEEIWPWVVQLGQERGGMYSYTWLENIFFADMHNVYEIKPELQRPRETGDTIWLASPDHFNGKGYQIIGLIIPHRAFVIVSGDSYKKILDGRNARGAWSIYLYPETVNSTWLIARSTSDEALATRFLRYVTYEIPHFIMEQKMLKTMKRLAEQKNLKNME